MAVIWRWSVHAHFGQWQTWRYGLRADDNRGDIEHGHAIAVSIPRGQ
jgi:hypothetical protein